MVSASPFVRYFADRIRRRRAARRTQKRRGFHLRVERLEDRSLLTGLGLWVSGATVHESGGYAMFTIGCSSSSPDPVSVEYRTVDGTATAGSDYDSVSGTLTFGSSGTATVAVSILDDALTEGDESFYLELFNAVNEQIGNSQAEGLIHANDRPPVLDPIADVEIDELQEASFWASAYDPDAPAETITYSLDSGAPAGAMIDPSSGTFSWLTEEVHGPGTFQVTVRATESVSGMSATQTVTITVKEVNEAPTTGGLADINVDEDSADTVVSLWSAFDDVEDGASGLTYAIVDNSDPSLFSSVSIDPATGELRLAYAANAWGWAAITVRATDSGGLTVESTMYVNVDPVNDAPIFASLSLVESSSGLWLVSASVSDIDDDVTGWSVSFGGILSGYDIQACLESDGTFSVLVDLPDLATGVAEAWTYDLAGLGSNIATASVTV